MSILSLTMPCNGHFPRHFEFFHKNAWQKIIPNTFTCQRLKIISYKIWPQLNHSTTIEIILSATCIFGSNFFLWQALGASSKSVYLVDFGHFPIEIPIVVEKNYLHGKERSQSKNKKIVLKSVSKVKQFGSMPNLKFFVNIRIILVYSVHSEFK